MKPSIQFQFPNGEEVDLPILEHLDIRDDVGNELATLPAVKWRYGIVLNKARSILEEVERSFQHWKSGASKWARVALRLQDDPRPTDKAIESQIRHMYSYATVIDYHRKSEFAQEVMQYNLSLIRDVDRLIQEIWSTETSIEQWEALVSQWKQIVSELELANKCLDTKGYDLSKLADLQIAGLFDYQAFTAKLASERLKRRSD